MTDEKIEEVTRPLNSVCKVLDYGEAVVIGSVVGQLICEIKRLRKEEQHEN